MDEKEYYDGTKLLTLSDINGNKPEIYICTGNKAAGKTTYFSRLMVNRFLRNGTKFGLIYRFNYELDDIADKFFKDIGSLFFKNYQMKAERRAKGIYAELYIAETKDNPDDMQWVPCGYGLTLNSCEQLKKYSHLFSDIGELLFDEFQSETNHYCNNEIHKFQLLHSTVARGQGEQSKYVPVYMLSNVVSITNIYFLALGISNRIQRDTKFLRGVGYVLQQEYNESAANAMKQSAFVQAFGNSKFNQYAIGNVYLNDNEAFVTKMPENGRYLVTIKHDGREYSVKEYPSLGVLYVSDSVDTSYPIRLTTDLNDHNSSYMLLAKHDTAIAQYKEYFNHGCVRFKNQLCKNAFLSLIAYNVL